MRLWIVQIHKRNDVEIAVTYVASNGIGDVMFILAEDSVQPWQELGQCLWWYHKIIDEWRRAETFDMLAQHIEALTADDPVFVRLASSFGDE